MHRPLRIRSLNIGQFHLCAMTAALALGTITTVSAGEVYQWKDAKGVTHYSQTPPAQGKFQARSIYQRQPAVDGQTVAATPTESPQCTTARNNIDLIQSGAKLKMDSDGDGKPDRDLSDTDREKQLQIAQTVARVNCNASTAKAP